MIAKGVRTMQKLTRGCGERVEGGLYLVGEGYSRGCPVLPLRIPKCETCGQPMIRFNRGLIRIDPSRTFKAILGDYMCIDDSCTRIICNPPERGWVMWVGREYTPRSFALEAEKWGVSKRISHYPKDLHRLDPVYLGYKTLFPKKEDKREIWEPGIFYAFRVTRIEKVLSREDAHDQKKVDDLIGKGITPVLEE